MTGERLRRSETPPAFVETEAGDLRHYPHSKTIGVHTIRYRRQKWHDWFAYESEDPDERPALRMRETFGWISRDNAVVGALRLREFDLCPLDSNEILWLAADDASRDASQALYVLCSQWREVGRLVGAHGPVLEVQGLWLRPAENASRGAELLNTFVQAAFHECSVCILKAFPLEYQSELGNGPSLESAFNSRRRAMQRYYARAAGIMTFPGPPGKEGWMWRPADRVAALIPTPCYSDEPFPNED